MGARARAKVRVRRREAVLGAWLSALLLTGCVKGRSIATRAVDYNVAAESARSEMLVLNVLRARDRKPMVFTGLTHISGSLRSSASIGASVAAGGDAESVGVFSPGFEASDAPTFDVAVLDSQEFTRGIMTPLLFEILEYFWDQGFNRELLFYLCVERIEVECPAGGGEAPKLLAIENDPADRSFGAFQSLLYAIADTGRWEINEHQVDPIGLPVPADALRQLGNLLPLAGSNLTLRPTEDGSFQLERPTTKRRLVVPAFDPCTGGPSARDLHLYDSKDALELASQRDPAEIKGRAVLRSPQAVLFYLGELTRPGARVAIRPRDPSQPESSRRLFVLREGGTCERTDVEVQYDGTKYVISKGEGDCDSGRSMQSLALAAQLLSLQQSAKDLPAAGTVRVVGQ